MVLYTCNNCTKNFKQKNDYERHKNRKNKCISINIDDNKLNNKLLDNSTRNPQNSINLQVSSTQLPHEPHNNSQSENTPKNYCNYCKKDFSRSDSLKRHQLFFCVPKEDEILNSNDDNKVLELLTKMNNKIDSLQENHKHEILELKNTIDELRASAAASSVTNNTTNNTNSNNTTNNTNNIIFNIVRFGNENPSKKLTAKDIQYIIGSHKNSMIYRSIERTHFNNMLPEYHNVYIPDKKMQSAIIFNGDKPDMKSMESVIDELLLNHVNNLDEYKKRKDVVISEHKHVEIDDIVDNFRDYKYTGSDKEKRIYKKAELEIKEMLYNNKESPINTQKKLRKNKQVIE